jgi:hypothetical protein
METYKSKTALSSWLPIIACLLALLIILLAFKQHSSSSTVDVSWPNCKVKTNTEFQSGIIGVTGGLDFKPNPCLGRETSWFSNYSLYMNTGYPGRSYGIKFASYPKLCNSTDYDCLAFNYGYNAAKYAINYANSQDAHSRTWWLDVETDNSWTLHSRINVSVLQGAIAAIRQVPFIKQIGIYSDSYQWNFLTGSWHNKLPIWIGTGSTSRQEALSSCRTQSFTRGKIAFVQYTQKIDIDLVCTLYPRPVPVVTLTKVQESSLTRKAVPVQNFRDFY